MSWTYRQPVKVIFGEDATAVLAREIDAVSGSRGLLITSQSFVRRGLAEKFKTASQGRITAIFGNIKPNPDVVQVDEAARLAREINADFIVALGGGSVLDSAKVVSVLAKNSDTASEYLSKVKPIPDGHLPVIAIPTTAGTGSEVTSVAVLSDHAAGIKVPLSAEAFYPVCGIVDPALTLTLSKHTTACTGFDALCHAIEAYWSRHHQPACDVLALQAIRLILGNIERAVADGSDLEARTALAEASVIAGMAFAVPKTSSAHACAYPLTGRLGIDHGEACTLTIDYFLRLNASRGCRRVDELARAVGFSDADALADEIARMKRETGMRTTLADFNLTENELEQLARESQHPNMLNNPVDISLDDLREMYKLLAKKI